MVRNFIPQGTNSSIDTNTHTPPQGFVPNAGISPGVDSEVFDESGIPGAEGAIIFDDGIETGFVLIEEA